MKNRILSITDKSKKKTGIIVICFALILTICTSLVLAASTNENYTPDPLIIVTEVNGVICEDMDYVFISDEKAVGTWEVVDFVKNIDDFEVGKKWVKEWMNTEILFWLSVEFSENGTGKVKFDTGVSNTDFKLTGIIRTNSIKWTNGLIKLYDTIPEYTIKHIDGADYMFIQWKSGDYTIRKMKPYYYVFKKTNEEVLQNE